jgi:steroid delta-isomerase-like uncharacterized protein
MSHHASDDLVERLTEAWNAHDPAEVSQCYAPDAVSRDISLAEPLHGRTAIRNAADMYMHAFPDIHFQILRLFATGDFVCEEWRATGTHQGDLMGLPPTGRKATVTGCNVMKVGDDGLISSETTYWDAAGLYRQLSALPDLANAGG